MCVCMCVCARVLGNGTVRFGAGTLAGGTKALPGAVGKKSSETPGVERRPRRGSRFSAGSPNHKAKGPRSLNFLSIEGVNLTFQRLDKAAQSCLLLNLLC